MILDMFKSEDGVDFVGDGLAGPRMAHAEFPSPELIPDTEKWVKASIFFFRFFLSLMKTCTLLPQLKSSSQLLFIIYFGQVCILCCCKVSKSSAFYWAC